MAQAPESESPDRQSPERRWLWIGGVGMTVTALCCATPILVIALGAIGLAGIGMYLDWVLIPLLLFFMVTFAVAWMRVTAKRRANGDSAAGSSS